MLERDRNGERTRSRGSIAGIVAGSVVMGGLVFWGWQSTDATRDAFDQNARNYLAAHNIPGCQTSEQKPCLEDVNPSGASATIRVSLDKSVEIHCAFEQTPKPGCFTGDEVNPYKTQITGPESIS